MIRLPNLRVRLLCGCRNKLLSWPAVNNTNERNYCFHKLQPIVENRRLVFRVDSGYARNIYWRRCESRGIILCFPSDRLQHLESRSVVYDCVAQNVPVLYSNASYYWVENIRRKVFLFASKGIASTTQKPRPCSMRVQWRAYNRVAINTSLAARAYSVQFVRRFSVHGKYTYVSVCVCVRKWCVFPTRKSFVPCVTRVFRSRQ